MFSFHIFIKMNASGGLNSYQKEQLSIFASKLRKHKIELIWIPEGGVRIRQIKNMMRQLNESFNNSGMLIHNVLISKDKKPGWLVSKAVRLCNIELSNGLCEQESDLKRITVGVMPEGRAFSSCLGHTVYILPDRLVLCPEAVSVRFNELSRELPLKNIFDTESFRTLLVSHIEKRQRCAAGCAYNRACNGGCPLHAKDVRCAYKAGADKAELTDDERFILSARMLSDIYRG